MEVMNCDEDAHYVVITRSGGSHVAMTSTTGSCDTLPRYNSDPINAMSSKNYRVGIQDSLSIGGHTHVLEEVEFKNVGNQPFVSTMTLVEITSGADLQGSGLTWVPWLHACVKFEKTCIINKFTNTLRGFLSQDEALTKKISVTPWYAHGFYFDVLQAINRILTGTTVTIIGIPEQYRVCYRSVIYSVRTSAGNMFFKACPKNSAEVKITSLLSECFPNDTVELVGVDNGVNGFLTKDFGTTFFDNYIRQREGPPRVGYGDCETGAGEFFRSWAQVQQLSVNCIERLKEGGIQVYGRVWMQEGLICVYEYTIGSGMMNKGGNTSLFTCVAFVSDPFKLWEASGIPKNLVHGDLHESNIAQPGGPGSPFLPFYWDSAFIGYPFMDLLDGELRSMYEYSSTYLDCWELYCSKDNILELGGRSIALQNLMAAIVAMRSDYYDEYSRHVSVVENMRDFFKYMNHGQRNNGL